MMQGVPREPDGSGLPVYRYDESAGRWVDSYLSDTLVGHWITTTNDIDGNTVLDRSGSGNDGALSGGTPVVDSPVGNAIDFDGTDDFLDLGDVIFDGPAAFTVTAWVNPDRLISSSIVPDGHGGEEVDYIIHKAGSANDSFGMTYNSEGIAVYVDDGNNHTVQTTTTPPVGEWSFVVVWFDSNELRLYINGVLEASTSDPTSALASNTNSTQIGARTEQDLYTDGQLSEIRVYNRTLDSSERQHIYDHGRLY